MSLRNWNWLAALIMVPALSLASVALSGCGAGDEAEKAAETNEGHEGHEDHEDHEGHEGHEGHDDSASTEHDHSGWWCNEHGVPEDECALCKTSLIVEFKEKGDWCEKHNRPDSQCFVCHPENFEKFAARYEAKFGEQPPKPTE